MNPALMAPTMPLPAYQAELSLLRYQGAAQMGQAYEQAMRSQEQNRNWFEVGMGFVGGAGFLAGSAVGTAVGGPIGGFVGGMAGSILAEGLRDPLESLFGINNMQPVVSGTQWTQGVISEQMHAMAFMGGNFGPGGRPGISMEQATNLGESMYGFMRSQGLQGMEITRLAPYIMQSGALDNSSNLQELTDNVERQVEAIANFVKRAGMKLEEAGQMTAGLVQAGVGLDDLVNVSNGMISTATAAGVSTAQYAQFATGFAQPYAMSGNIDNLIGGLNQEVLFQDYLYSTGAVSRAEYNAAGGAMGAGGMMAQTNMNYWNSSANRRILYGMTAAGGLNASGIQSMLAGEAFPDAGMSTYENMTDAERAATRWRSREMLNENPNLFTDVMLSRMMDDLSDDGYTDPFSQRQMLMERYGVPRSMATQMERREELMFDPRTQMGIMGTTAQSAVQAERTQNIASYNTMMQRILGLGRAVNTGERLQEPYGDRQRFMNRMLAGEDYATLVQEETINPNSAMSSFLNADLAYLQSGGNMSFDAIQAAFGTMSEAERAQYGPLIEAALNEALQSQDVGVIGDDINLRTEAQNVGFFTPGEAEGRWYRGDATIAYNENTQSFDVTTGGRTWSANEYSFRDMDIAITPFVNAMARGADRNIDALTRANNLNTMASYMPTQTQMLYGQEFQRRYYDQYGQSAWGPSAIGSTRDLAASSIEQTADMYRYFASAPTRSESETALTNRWLGNTSGLDTWFDEALQKQRNAGLVFSGSYSDANDVYGFTNELATELFGYSTTDPRFSATDRQRLDYFTSIAYPSFANNQESYVSAAADAVGGSNALARQAGSPLTATERQMRAAIGQRYSLNAQDWASVSDVLMMSYSGDMTTGEAANTLGVTDEGVLGAVATMGSSRAETARAAVIAAGTRGGVQMAGAGQALTAYSSLLTATSAEGKAITMPEAIAAYGRGEAVDFNYAEGIAGTSQGALLQELVEKDTLSEDTLRGIIEETNRRSGAANADSATTGFEGNEFGISSENVTIQATGAVSVIAEAVSMASGAASNSGVTSGSPGYNMSGFSR